MKKFFYFCFIGMPILTAIREYAINPNVFSLVAAMAAAAALGMIVAQWQDAL
jgi:hypothetical protein